MEFTTAPRRKVRARFIIQDVCIECGATPTQDAHIIPAIMGGTVTVPLCEDHHRMQHGLEARGPGSQNHRELTRLGIERARASGKQWGSQTTHSTEVIVRILAARAAGRSYLSIARELTEDGVRTGYGYEKWYPATVKRAAESLRAQEILAANAALSARMGDASA